MIPGFTYDIFISYRQKDNKGERWVNKFVEALKTELDSAFKEDISIYFDENPEDRLKETHDVDKSLENKLKCVIFIPILSQTYCDPKSYAWQNEILPFIKLTKNDEFGKDVKLRNGNFASRILPVRINDLESEDINLFEKETGSKLRSMDFVFKTASGVNRPLRINEDHPNDNLNKTYYLDQINKLANAITELYRSLNTGSGTSFREEGKNDKSADPLAEKNNKNVAGKSFKQKSKKMLVIISSVILFLAGAFAVFKFINPGEKNKEIEKSIAVLPFVNDSPEEQNTYFINGIMGQILENLQKIKDFRVLSRTSTEKFRGNEIPSIPEIAKQIGVNYIVEGSGQKYGNKVVLHVQLIAAKNEKHLWGNDYKRDIQATSDIISIQNEIAQAIAKELKTIMTPEEKHSIESTPTKNLTAYDYYLRARDVNIDLPMGAINRDSVKKAEILLKKALENDSTFALAYTGLAGLYWKKDSFSENRSKNLLDSMLHYANIGLLYDNQLAEGYIIRAGYYAERTGNLNKALEELDKALKINPNSWEAYHEKAKYYEWSGDLVSLIENRKKAASLNHGSKLPELLSLIASAYLQAGFPGKASEFYLETLKLQGDSIQYLNRIVDFETISGNFNKANEILGRISRMDSAYADLDPKFGVNFMLLGQYKEALKYFKRWEKKTGVNRMDRDISLSDLIGFVLLKNGQRREAESYFDRQIEYCEGIIKSKPFELSISIMNLELAGIYAVRGDKARAYESLKIFDRLQKYDITVVSNLKYNPFFESIRNEPEFVKIQRDVETKYLAEHERVKKWLAEQGLM